MELAKAVHVVRLRLKPQLKDQVGGTGIALATEVAGAYSRGLTLTVFAVPSVPVGSSISDVAAEARAPIIQVLGALSFWFDEPITLSEVTRVKSSLGACLSN